MNPQELPEPLKTLFQESFPDLVIEKSNLTDWIWKDEEDSSDDWFFTWEEALIDYIFHLRYKVKDLTAELEQ